MTLILLILFSWTFLKAFQDAVIFAKGGEDCFTVWHLVDWTSRWLIPLYAIYKLGYYRDVQLMAILVVGSLGFNFMYKLFRVFNVYKIDNSLRWKWIDKILNRGGII